jgi:choline kinase/putative flippase GtrA
LPDALPPICILAGGLGTRLGNRVRDTPKPLLDVAGEPFVLHQLRLLAGHGATRVVLCVGYLGELIERRVGREQFGLRIDYSYDGPELDGTLGAIRRAVPLLDESFLVLYGDTYLRLDYAAAVAQWRASGLPAMMTVLRNDGRWDVSNAVFADGRVVAYDKHAPTAEMQWIDYGLGGLSAEALALAEHEERDLATLYNLLALRGRLFGYEATERFYEIGTPRGLNETETFLHAIAEPTSRAAAGRGRLLGLSDMRAARRAEGIRGALRLLNKPDPGILGQGLRFGLAGGIVAAVYLASTTVLAEVVGLPFQVALVLGFAFAISVHFTLQRKFVWVHDGEFALPLRQQAGRYLVVAAAQYGLTAASTLVLPHALGLPTEIVYLATVAGIIAVNFVVFRHGIFHASAP